MLLLDHREVWEFWHSAPPPTPKKCNESQNLSLAVLFGISSGVLVWHQVGASKEHALRSAMLTELQKRLGADSVEARVLPLGDVLWIWRNATGEVRFFSGERCWTRFFSFETMKETF